MPIRTYVGSCLAGFGVLATVAVVAKLREGRPAPHRVRVDSLASVAVEAGVLGAALAAGMVDALTAGGRRYENGRLVTSRLGADPQQPRPGACPRSCVRFRLQTGT